MRRRLALAPLLALACATAGAAQAKDPMKTLDFPRDVKKRIDRDMAAAKASTTPERLTFSLEGEPRLEGTLVLLKGVLENPTDADVSVVVFPVVDWASPFYVRLLTDAHVAFRPLGPDDPPPQPPAPPPPMRLEVPARSRVVFDGFEDLSRYTWTGTPEVAFEWTFLFWNAPKPAGKFTFRLPAK